MDLHTHTHTRMHTHTNIQIINDFYFVNSLKVVLFVHLKNWAAINDIAALWSSVLTKALPLMFKSLLDRDQFIMVC